MSAPLPLLLAEAAAIESVRSLTLGEWMGRWHEFYLMAGTAAVTLAGLLFVALSLHLDRLVEESHEHLLALARVTLLSFTIVLIASMFMLMPSTGRRQTSFTLGLVSVMGLATTYRLARTARHHDEAGFSRGQIRKRLMFPAIGYLMMMLTAAGIYRGVPEMLYMMVGAMCMILGNAAGTSWELLVQIARQRRASQRR